MFSMQSMNTNQVPADARAAAACESPCAPRQPPARCLLQAVVHPQKALSSINTGRNTRSTGSGSRISSSIRLRKESSSGGVCAGSSSGRAGVGFGAPARAADTSAEKSAAETFFQWARSAGIEFPKLGAGTFDGEISSTFQSLGSLKTQRASGEAVQWGAAPCAGAYRDSQFEVGRCTV